MGFFTAPEDRLIAWTLTDLNGKYEIRDLPAGLLYFDSTKAWLGAGSGKFNSFGCQPYHDQCISCQIFRCSCGI